MADLRLDELVRRLRAECPWDRAQTLGSMRPYLLEETHEVLDALDRADVGRLREELGDLLFQVHLLAAIAGLELADVEAGITQKLVARHPHVFAGEAGGSPHDWERKKAEAAPDRSRVDGVPPALPALVRAHRVAEKVAAVGFDWPDRQGVLDKIDEERAELDEALRTGEGIAHEYGDLLLAVANLGRFLGISAEDALRAANGRFEGRFRGVEARARAAGVPLAEAGLAQLNAWWDEAKRSS